jgi:hypothetical protein
MSTIEDERRQLWCAVVLQAIEDATSPLGDKRSRNHEIVRARAWLTRPSRDFAEVCRMAGYEPDRIRAQVTGRIEQAALLDCPPPPKPRKPRAPRCRTSTTNVHNEGEPNVARQSL